MELVPWVVSKHAFLSFFFISKPVSSEVPNGFDNECEKDPHLSCLALWDLGKNKRIGRSREAFPVPFSFPLPILRLPLLLL